MCIAQTVVRIFSGKGITSNLILKSCNTSPSQITTLSIVFSAIELTNVMYMIKTVRENYDKKGPPMAKPHKAR